MFNQTYKILSVRRFLLAISALLIVCAPVAFAQGSGDYNRVEVAVGYSHMRGESTVGAEVLQTPGGSSTIDPCTTQGGQFFGTNFQRFFCARRGFNGFDASAVYNFSRYVGLKGNVSGHFNSETFVDGATNVETRTRVYNFLAGVQIKDNRKEGRALRPFAHALLGGARVSFNTRQTNQFAPPPFNDFIVSDSRMNFAMKLGGGLDVQLGRRVDLRLVEINYNPVFGGERQLTGGPFPQTPVTAQGRTAHNFTVGIGIVLH
ncbi:MAG: hypothetical protein QOH25_2736 [Acidobacteriota bacterium]|jgi:opacity protein-like surface antigen|nr:hypothetical protein [Acidobacteriota bacterium]